MQGQRASLGSLSEALNFEHGSTSSNAVIDQQIRWNDSIHGLDETELQDFMISPNDTNLMFSNSIYQEQRDLNRFSLGEASSSGTKNEGSSNDECKAEHEREIGLVDLNSLFVQSSNSNRTAQNLNLNSDFISHGEDANQVMGHPGLYGSNRQRNEPVSPTRVFEDNGGRPGSSPLEGCRASCKRKAVDGNIGQPSSSCGVFQRGETSSWNASPAYYNLGSSLNISGSIEQGPRGLTPGFVSDIPVPVIAESSHRNSRVRINPPNHHETLNPGIFSAGSVVRRPVPPTLPHSSRILPMDQNHLTLRPRSVLGNVVSESRNVASATQVTTVPRNLQPFRWNSSSNPLLGGSSSSVVPVDRNIVPREDIRSRSLSRNILDNPLLMPPPEWRSLARNPTNGNLIGGNLNVPGNVGSRVGSNVQFNPTWAPNQTDNPPHYQRRLNELVRRSLLSSLAGEPGNQRGRSSLPPTSLEEVLPPSGAVNINQGHNRNYHRTASWLERQGDSVIGIPHSLRVLASASRGRSRLVASEIRNVLDLMRRGENLRIEDVMLLDQSVFLGAADIHDRYRDMRVDVDNMSYEELLALEERIGDVCTGLSEETIFSRLKQRKHTSDNGSQQDAEPCCICQEEYNDGEDLGTLKCGHDFHTDCIKQWLKRKNLCPVCKTTGLITTEKPIR